MMLFIHHGNVKKKINGEIIDVIYPAFLLRV